MELKYRIKNNVKLPQLLERYLFISNAPYCYILNAVKINLNELYNNIALYSYNMEDILNIINNISKTFFHSINWLYYHILYNSNFFRSCLHIEFMDQRIDIAKRNFYMYISTLLDKINVIYIQHNLTIDDLIKFDNYNNKYIIPFYLEGFLVQPQVVKDITNILINDIKSFHMNNIEIDEINDIIDKNIIGLFYGVIKYINILLRPLDKYQYEITLLKQEIDFSFTKLNQQLNSKYCILMNNSH